MPPSFIVRSWPRALPLRGPAQLARSLSGCGAPFTVTAILGSLDVTEIVIMLPFVCRPVIVAQPATGTLNMISVSGHDPISNANARSDTYPTPPRKRIGCPTTPGKISVVLMVKDFGSVEGCVGGAVCCGGIGEGIGGGVCGGVGEGAGVGCGVC